MATDKITKSDWYYIPAPRRMDAFNFELTKQELERAAQTSRQIAIDVSTAHFVSIPMIKFLHSLASEMVRKGGRLALVGPSEKLKRQIHIFASLDPLTLYSQNNWERQFQNSPKGHA